MQFETPEGIAVCPEEKNEKNYAGLEKALPIRSNHS
jgi:hypothetical protein